MLEDIESLNRKIFQSATDLYELKVQKQEAELAYLRSQVDPHFLYNTLEGLTTPLDTRRKNMAQNTPAAITQPQISSCICIMPLPMFRTSSAPTR